MFLVVAVMARSASEGPAACYYYYYAGHLEPSDQRCAALRPWRHRASGGAALLASWTARRRVAAPRLVSAEEGQVAATGKEGARCRTERGR